MSTSTQPAPAPRRTYVWWVILCLVGLDYFSSLAYLPSIAVGLLKDKAELAPFAGVGVVLITLLAALPVYWYVVGRSPHGEGGIGLLERCFHGWAGKLLVLALLGFIATDFVITRSLSTSDAGAHVVHNDVYQEFAKAVKSDPEKYRQMMPGSLQGRFFNFWNEQLLLTVALAVATFGLYFFLVTTLSRGFVSVAVGVVGLYLLVNLLVLGGALYFLLGTADGREFVREWETNIRPEIGDLRAEYGGPLLAMMKLALLTFPAMAIGLSGFELSMASAPMVRGDANDAPERPAGRIRRTRLLLLAAAVVMSLLVLASIFVVTLLVWEARPKPDGGSMRVLPQKAENRSLSYLAHGDRLRQGEAKEDFVPGSAVLPFAGPAFGFVYDVSTVLILCLAGASATISLKDIVPNFLSRFGMQMVWAHKIGVITHLFNVLILVVTVAFGASVVAQQWAYAASVLALLFGAALAATLDVRQRLSGSLWLWPASLPFLLITLLFLVMGFLIVYQNPTAVAIALLFVGVVLGTAIASRYLRSAELRHDGFDFATPECESRWHEVRRLEFQALVPHDPHTSSLRAKGEEIRHRHRLGPDVAIIFIEVAVGDPSDFHNRPSLRIDREGFDEVIRVSRCTSISNVITAVALEFREAGEPPELYFSWSESSPLYNSLTYLLFGEGNVPLLVRAMLKKAEPDEKRRPRVIVG